MRDFAKAFYLSKEWRRARAYVFNRDAGLCVRCGALGEIVHHKEHLTPQNISNPEIALGEGNLELLCGTVTPSPTPGSWQQTAGSRSTTREMSSSVSFCHSKSGSQRKGK